MIRTTPYYSVEKMLVTLNLNSKIKERQGGLKKKINEVLNTCGISGRNVGDIVVEYVRSMKETFRKEALSLG